MKIYTNDPNLPHKTTRLNALYTRAEVDGLFAKTCECLLRSVVTWGL